MKFLDEYRDADLAQKMAAEIHRVTTKPWTIMEICGGQTHAIVKFGIDELLPKNITLIHGPGCPVCVTPLEVIDKALELYPNGIAPNTEKANVEQVRLLSGLKRLGINPQDKRDIERAGYFPKANELLQQLQEQNKRIEA